MKIDFSKPSEDIAIENLKLLNNNDSLLSRQQRILKTLAKYPQRSICLICSYSLKNAAVFKHRNIDYYFCPVCNHIQSKPQPPQEYPIKLKGGISFDQIYPKLDIKEYEHRKNRIYRPKLDWILDCSQELGLERKEMINMKWFELGCGAGYFLDALADVGANYFSGVDSDIKLVNIANKMLPSPSVRQFQGSLAEVVNTNHADIYVAFFVLEHIEDTKLFLKAMYRRSAGTIFIFSVPVFGFASILESGSNCFFARSLDSVIHTQLYTDRSIKYCLKQAGYKIIAQWIFGQDSADLLRMLLITLKDKYPKLLLNDIKTKLKRVQDPIQQVLDINFMSDARHIIAVKR